MRRTVCEISAPKDAGTFYALVKGTAHLVNDTDGGVINSQKVLQINDTVQE